MAESIEDLIRRGRLLSSQDRERLVQALLESPRGLGPLELDPAWSEEIAQRMAAHVRGDIQSIDATEVFAKARLLAR